MKVMVAIMRRNLLIGLIFLAGIVAIYTAIRNNQLKKGLQDAQHVSTGYDRDDLFNEPQKNGRDVKIVRNRSIPPTLENKKIKLIRELVIGGEDGDENAEFYRPWPVFSDIYGNIYVCESASGQIKKFDRNGNYLTTIGQKGAGPGEFSGSLLGSFDSSAHLWVYDYGTQRLSKFTSTGVYQQSIPLTFINPPASFVMDDKNLFYFSMYDPTLEKVVHIFDSSGKLISSFGEPAKLEISNRFIARTSRKSYYPSVLAIAGGYIYSSQKNPYKIDQFTMTDELVMRILRENGFMPSPAIKIVGKETYRLSIPATSRLIARWGDMIINWVYIPRNVSKTMGSAVDLFDLNGQLLASLLIPEKIYATHMDKNGKIYGTVFNQEKFTSVVRYRIEL